MKLRFSLTEWGLIGIIGIVIASWGVGVWLLVLMAKALIKYLGS